MATAAQIEAAARVLFDYGPVTQHGIQTWDTLPAASRHNYRNLATRALAAADQVAVETVSEATRTYLRAVETEP